MGAAEKSETLVGVEIHNSAVKSGLGLHSGLYTVTVATQNDWVIFSDFSEVKFVHAQVSATGVANACTIDSTDKNKVVFTSSTTGAMVAHVFGIKA